MTERETSQTGALDPNADLPIDDETPVVEEIDPTAHRVGGMDNLIALGSGPEDMLRASAANVPDDDRGLTEVEREALIADEVGSATEAPVVGDTSSEGIDDTEAPPPFPVPAYVPPLNAWKELGSFDIADLPDDVMLVPTLLDLRVEGKRRAFTWMVEAVILGTTFRACAVYLTEATYVVPGNQPTVPRVAAGYWQVTSGPPCPFLQLEPDKLNVLAWAEAPEGAGEDDDPDDADSRAIAEADEVEDGAADRGYTA